MICHRICCNSTLARPAVRTQELQWLAQLQLPRALRVAPAETLVPGALSPGSEETRTPRSGAGAEDLYERLHREAMDYHARKKERHEKEGLFRPIGSPCFEKPCGNTAPRRFGVPIGF